MRSSLMLFISRGIVGGGTRLYVSAIVREGAPLLCSWHTSARTANHAPSKYSTCTTVLFLHCLGWSVTDIEHRLAIGKYPFTAYWHGKMKPHVNVVIAPLLVAMALDTYIYMYIYMWDVRCGPFAVPKSGGR